MHRRRDSSSSSSFSLSPSSDALHTCWWDLAPLSCTASTPSMPVDGLLSGPQSAFVTPIADALPVSPVQEPQLPLTPAPWNTSSGPLGGADAALSCTIHTTHDAFATATAKAVTGTGGAGGRDAPLGVPTDCNTAFYPLADAAMADAAKSLGFSTAEANTEEGYPPSAAPRPDSLWSNPSEWSVSQQRLRTEPRWSQPALSGRSLPSSAPTPITHEDTQQQMPFAHGRHLDNFLDYAVIASRAVSLPQPSVSVVIPSKPDSSAERPRSRFQGRRALSASAAHFIPGSPVLEACCVSDEAASPSGQTSSQLPWVNKTQQGSQPSAVDDAFAMTSSSSHEPFSFGGGRSACLGASQGDGVAPQYTCNPNSLRPLASGAVTTTTAEETMGAPTSGITEDTPHARAGDNLAALPYPQDTSATAGRLLRGAAGGRTRSPRCQSHPQQSSLSASHRSLSTAGEGPSKWPPLPPAQCTVRTRLMGGGSGGARRGSVDWTPLKHPLASERSPLERRPDVFPSSASPQLSLPSVGTETVPLLGAKESSPSTRANFQRADLRHQQPHSGVPGGTPTPGLLDGFGDGLNGVAELRRRLLTEDFFSNPISKLRRDGTFPWKLMMSALLLLLLLVQVTWCHLPLDRANEAMRLAITKHFTYGDMYYRKSKGDIVSAPTAWMENLYTSIEEFIQVYYNLTNASSAKTNYLYKEANSADPCRSNRARTNTEVKGGGKGRVVGEGRLWRLRDEWKSPLSSLQAAQARRSPGPLRDIAAATEPCAGLAEATDAPAGEGLGELPPFYIPLSDIAPVLMRVEVDVYSYREGADNINLELSPLQSSATASRHIRNTTHEGQRDYADNGGRVKYMDMGRHRRRWLTFYVDADRPLGPFMEYQMPMRNSREAQRRGRQRAGEPRKMNTTDPFIEADGVAVGDVPEHHNVAEGAVSRGRGAALSAVCMPRYDDLIGRYYLPCVSMPPTTLHPEAEAAAAEGAATPIVTEYSLMDNVHRIQLEVTLRHEMSEVGDHLAVPAGALQSALFSTKRVVGSTDKSFGAAAPSVFQWHVLKDITVHPGGLVETQLRVSTRVWTPGSSHIFCMRYIMAVLLIFLAVIAIVLQLRALQRIFEYNRRLGKDHEDFLVQPPPHCTPVDGTYEARLISSHNISSAPLFHVRATVPYEWGIPGSPLGAPTGMPARGSRATGCIDAADEAAAHAFPNVTPSSITAANYGTMKHHSDDSRARRPDGHSEAALSLSPPADVSLRNISSPILDDFSAPRCGCGRQGGAANISASCDSHGQGSASLAHARNSAELHQRSAESSVGRVAWLSGTLRWLFCGWWSPSLGTLMPSSAPFPPSAPIIQTQWLEQRCDDSTGTRAGDAPVSIPRRFSINRGGTPVSAVASNISFSSLLHTPATPQQAERIMERSYVDVHATWRRYLQQSKGVGWHWVAVVSAVITLCYGALLLAPLQPFVQVSQTNVYSMWTSVLLGVASLLSCVQLLSYLRFFPTFYFPVMASLHVVPKLFIFGLCISPLFLGFALFFVIAFGAHSDGSFSTLSWASVRLYFMTYGDFLLPTIGVAANTPYTMTAFFAGALVVSFVLIFFLIMLNMAMSITQHEWLRLRRRFGAALSTSSLLFSVRSRSEVKREAIEAVRANLEVLWYMLREDEEERQRGATAARSPPSPPVLFNLS